MCISVDDLEKYTMQVVTVVHYGKSSFRGALYLFIYLAPSSLWKCDVAELYMYYFDLITC